MSTLAAAVKFGLACCGPGLVFFHIHLFRKYFDLGKPVPDETHVIPLNNHGTYKYITELQSQNLDASLGATVVMLFVLFIMILMRIRKERMSA